MRIPLARSAPVLLLAALAVACTNENKDQAQELAQMRIEIEQLTNALGRLEFRIYELESQQGTDAAANNQAAGVTSENAVSTGATQEAEPAPEKSTRRFDLAPVE